jgi:hypothetical protein
MLLTPERTGEGSWDYWRHWDAGLVVHLTRPLLREIFGSAGVLRVGRHGTAVL